MLYRLNIYNYICQLSLSKVGKKEEGVGGLRLPSTSAQYHTVERMSGLRQLLMSPGPGYFFSWDQVSSAIERKYPPHTIVKWIK